MSILQESLNMLYKSIELRSDGSIDSSVELVDDVIELLTIYNSELNYGNNITADEISSIITNLQSDLIDDSVFELEIIINLIGE